MKMCKPWDHTTGLAGFMLLAVSVSDISGQEWPFDLCIPLIVKEIRVSPLYLVWLLFLPVSPLLF